MIPTSMIPHFNAYVQAVLEAEKRSKKRAVILDSNEAVSTMLKEWAAAFDKLHAEMPDLSRSDVTALVVIHLTLSFGDAVDTALRAAGKAKGD